MYRYNYSSITPSFVNVIKPKRSFINKALSTSSISSLNSLIDGAQKAINIYNKAVPIIKQTAPMINNIKTTFKVARAFKSFSKESSLEKAFDNLPDYNQEKKENTHSKLSNPFYPWYTNL